MLYTRGAEIYRRNLTVKNQTIEVVTLCATLCQ